MAVGIALLLVVCNGTALALDPLRVVREFCRADGLGERLQARTLPAVGALVAWSVEPAWDRIFLIKGYEISAPLHEDDAVTIAVTYTVVTEVRPGRTVRGERLEVRTLRLAADQRAGTWRIVGPPPFPHVFESRVDAVELAAALDPHDGGFPSNSAFVWRTLNEEGQNLPYLDTLDLAGASMLVPAEEPSPGDVVFYYDGGDPYHVGIVAAEGAAVSATSNGGVRQTPVDAFAGQARFMRLVGSRSAATRPAASPEGGTPTVVPAESSPSPSERTPTPAPPLGAQGSLPRVSALVFASVDGCATCSRPSSVAESCAACPGYSPCRPALAARTARSATASPARGSVAATLPIPIA